jgi:hypothetical protein
MASLDPGALQNMEVLLHTCAGYIELGLAPTAEILAYNAYYSSFQKVPLGFTGKQLEAIERLRTLSVSERRNLCRYTISDPTLEYPDDDI